MVAAAQLGLTLPWLRVLQAILPSHFITYCYFIDISLLHWVVPPPEEFEYGIPHDDKNMLLYRARYCFSSLYFSRNMDCFDNRNVLVFFSRLPRHWQKMIARELITLGAISLLYYDVVLPIWPPLKIPRPAEGCWSDGYNVFHGFNHYIMKCVV